MDLIPAIVTLNFDSTNLLSHQCIDIAIIDDNLIEGVEEFSVSLIAQNNANGQIILQTSSGSVFIADNDGMLLYWFQQLNSVLVQSHTHCL